MSLLETGDAIAWWPSSNPPDPRPSRLPGFIPGQTSPYTPGRTPRETADAMPPETALEPYSQPSDPVVVTSTTGEYAVQFASYTSEQRAWKGWDSLRGEAAGLLNVIKPNVLRADLGEAIGVVYRLRTVSTPKAIAERLCEALRSRGVDCLVVKSDPAVADTGATG